MLRCLFCDAELSDTLLRSGCCPVCGGRLMWPDDADEAVSAPESETPAPLSPPPSPAPQISAPAANSDPPPMTPPPAAVRDSQDASQSPTPPPSPTPAARDARGAASELPPELLARVTAAWSGAFDSREIPRNTIKASSLDTATAPGLVIRPRQLGGRDRPPVDQPDYELLEIIGEGGVGVVYSARQSSIDRTVAVKMLKPGSAGEAVPEDKFLAEAVVTGELEHPNIVPIYDLGSSHDGTLFYSMKRVLGTPWDRAMSGKSLPENIEILMKVCDAVAFAHSRGVIHRDLKPENIMLGGFGEVLVMDWGIALAWSGDGRAQNIRQSATMGGTPAYMAPEMATGPLDVIGVPSDVYLLGGMLYEVVTGLSPHTGKTVMDCLYAAAANEIQPSDVGGELVEIALKAMSTRPQARYQSVQEFQDAIRSYQSHAESIVLSNRAQDDLKLATREQKYEVFARSLFAFEEAVALWAGNEAAAKGVIEARRAYAEAALAKHDYELGLSLVDADEPRHRKVAERLGAGQKEQQTRSQRIRLLKQVAAGLLIAMMTGGALALYEINEKRDIAESQRQSALNSQRNLEKSIDENSELLIQQVSLLSDVAKERDRATLALEEEAASRAAAQQARRREQQETYVAQIGLAAERIDANAFEQAAELLENYRDSPLAHWEWARLWYICRPHRSMHEAGGIVQFAGYIPGASAFLVVTQNGEAAVWIDGADLQAEPATRFSIEGGVSECALSPDGRRLAVSASNSAEIRLFNLQFSEADLPAGIAEDGVRLTGHTGTITSLEFSTDGTQLLSGSLDYTARLWDVATGRSLIEFQGHNWSVWQAAFSPNPDDRVMATAGQDGRVIVWSTTDGSQITDFNEHRGPVHCLAFSPDGATIATAGEDRRILVWKWRDVSALDLAKLVADGSRPDVPFRRLDGHRSSVHCLAFSPAGNGKLVSGGNDNTLMVWDVAAESGSAIVPLRGHSRRITTCAFSPDGLQVLSGSEDRKWGQWDVAGFQEVNQLRSTSLRGHENGILAAHFGRDGRRIVTAGLDRTARIWDAETGRELTTLREGHEYLATNAVLLNDGAKLLTGGGDNTARLWDLTSGAQTAVLSGTGRYAAIAVSADGQLALTGAPAVENIDEDAGTSLRVYARLWNLASQTVLREFTETIEADRVEAQPMSAVSAVAISPDGSLFYTGHADGQGRLWRDGEETPGLLRAHTRSVTAAAFVGPEGSRLLTASGDKTVAHWDVATGKEIVELAMRHDGWVSSLSVTDDGQTAVTAAEDGLVRVWNVATAAEVARLNGNGDLVDGLSFLNGGESLLWVGDDGVVRITDPAGQADERILNAFAGDWIYSVAVAPSGGRLAVVTGTGRLSVIDIATARVVWRVRTPAARDVEFAPAEGWLACGGSDGLVRIVTSEGEEARQWQAHEGEIRQLAVSPDGGRIATAADDRLVRIWDAATGEQLHELNGHSASVSALAWSSSGEFIVSGGDDGELRCWSSGGDALETIPAHSGSVGAIAISPDGQSVVSGGIDRTLRVWLRGSDSPLAELDAHEGAIRSLAFSPDGGTLASLAADRALRIWDTAAWKWLAEIPKGRGMSTHPIGAISADGSTVLAGNSGERVFRLFSLNRESEAALTLREEMRADVGAVWSALLTDDGSSMVTVGGDAARVWNLASGREVLTMRPHNVVSAVAPSPDGSQVVTGSWDRSARIWDAATGRMLRQLTDGHSGAITQAVWLADGNRIITAGDDGIICLWNAATGDLDGARLETPAVGILSLCVSRRGTEAATVSSDNVVRIWDLTERRLLEELSSEQLGVEGQSLLCCALGPEGGLLAVGTPSRALIYARGESASPLVLTGHTAAIRALAFSPDGKRLVTGSEDFTAKVWDVGSGKEMLSLARHAAAVTSVEFSEDGLDVLTAGMDGLAIVWGGDAIAPSIRTSRERFDVRAGDAVTPVDPLVELNAPTTSSPAGLRVVVQLEPGSDPSGRMGNLCLSPGENSTAAGAGNDALTGDTAFAAERGAKLEVSDNARRLDIVFDEQVSWSDVIEVLRSVAFQLSPDESALSMEETHVETVTWDVIESDGAPDLSRATSSIDIFILPATETDAGSVLQDVEQVLRTLKSREVEQ